MKSDDGASVLVGSKRDLWTQIVISVVFGLSAFLAFCVLRPRWTGLYAARQRQKRAASSLPHLPTSFFGWIPVVHKITEDEVLASAGLDAFVFLAFFKMATKYLGFLLFFSFTVIYPVHKNFSPNHLTVPNNGTQHANHTDSIGRSERLQRFDGLVLGYESGPGNGSYRFPFEMSNDYLWIYVVFAYLFSGFAVYLIVTETQRVIRIRQRYLGAQTSVTDRTIRLSGIPANMRNEDAIRTMVERLETGRVESVTLCKDWKELDDLCAERMTILRRLEEAWTVHLGSRRAARRVWTFNPTTREHNEDGEETELLGEDQPYVASYSKPRPTTRIWYGFMNLQSRKVDAIDYYEEKLRKLDEKIQTVKGKDFTPTSLAFVTLDSAAACQMVCQAIIDPEPMQLMAKPAPDPAGVVWRNTYLSRRNRMIRSWTITAVILVLTVVWSFLLVPLAGILSDTDGIRQVWPELADFLEGHGGVVQSLIQTLLPTLLIALLGTAVPYLYDWLSQLQGMTSQGDIEMSIISKNFFFTFFNLFLIFTIFGAGAKALSALDRYDEIKKHFQDLPALTLSLADGLRGMSPFYMNYIVLQTFGLFPFRLLEFGVVTMYPIGLIGSKTPRDYAELVQPPEFRYGFFLPQTLFIFIICTVYSVFPNSELLPLFGLIYFLVGGFIYKYQLLYAMDHRQFSTGKAWPMICVRFIVGLVFFQGVMAGQMALQSAWKRSVLVIPLIIATIWFGISYRRTYEPLMTNIALRSLHNDDSSSLAGSRNLEGNGDRRRVNENTEVGSHYVNPNLVAPLEEVWLAKKGVIGTNVSGIGGANSV